MITKEGIINLLNDIESSHAERTISTTNTDKFGEAICAFSNDLSDCDIPGYLLIGAYDDGRVAGLKATDELLKNIAAIRTDGNIQPQPSMNVEKVSFDAGDIIVVEVFPAQFTPVRYKGKIWVRVGPRKTVANEGDEKILLEKRASNIFTFDALPCLNTTIEDLNLSLFKNEYLPKAFPEQVLKEDNRTLEQQLQALGFYDFKFKCPTNAGMLLLGKYPQQYFRGAFVQYVHFEGSDRGGNILKELRFEGNLMQALVKMDNFVELSISARKPLPVSALREEIVISYPYQATRELLMNAVMHRDYEANTPTHFYEYDNYIEIMNPGGLYGKANIQNFPHVNDYRNPIIAEAMKVLGYVNRFSRGIDRVQKDLEENGNGKAEFNFSLTTAFEVKEHINKKAVLLHFLEKEKPKSDNAIKILSFCLKGKSSKEILDMLGLSNQTYNYSRHIVPLLKKDLLNCTFPNKITSRNQQYFTTEKGISFLRKQKEQLS